MPFPSNEYPHLDCYTNNVLAVILTSHLQASVVLGNLLEIQN